jgi:PhnB protein
MHIEPYLHFDGRAEEAAEFYQQAVGATVEMILRYQDSPDKPPPGMVPPGSDNKVMHMALRIGNTTLLGSDGACKGKPAFGGVDLALQVSGPDEAKRMFDGLAQGGTVRMALTKTFFSDAYGILVDKFGVTWMLVSPGAMIPPR